MKYHTVSYKQDKTTIYETTSYTQMILDAVLHMEMMVKQNALRDAEKKNRNTSIQSNITWNHLNQRYDPG